MSDVKICGISTPDAMTAAIEGGARYVGLVFYPKSPRHVDLEIAGYLARYVPTAVRSVGLFVDPSDEELQRTLSSVQLDMIQLHGHESADRVAAIKSKFALPIIKAIPVSQKSDLGVVSDYECSADMMLFDAKPAPDADLPGGNGLPFDWNILKDYSGTKPWFLAGGLTPENVGEAISRLNPNAVDVSSGVESKSGVKDINKIKKFLNASKK